MKKKIYLASPHMSAEGFEQNFVKEAFDTNWIAPLGPNVDGFENEFSEKIGIDNSVALVSGTSAIHMALKSVGIGEGDIVLCQSLTFSASANPIIYQNAIPVFVDSDYETWNMNPKYLEEALKKYPNAKAVIVVHLYGLSANMDKIKELCRKYDVTLIEDAAESLGTTYKGTYTGTLGDYGIFSFNGNKIITTSGGGMLVSNDKSATDKIRFWITQSRDQARHYQHSELGYNYRLSNVLAGIGRGQLKVLDERVIQKQKIFEFYKSELGHLDGIDFMPVNDWNKPNFWLTCLTLRGKITPMNIIKVLEQNNIEARPLWKPMHIQPYFAGFDYVGEFVSEDLFKRGVCLPSDTKMSIKDLNQIVKLIKGLWS